MAEKYWRIAAEYWRITAEYWRMPKTLADNQKRWLISKKIAAEFESAAATKLL
jgi:hypothetical protein